MIEMKETEWKTEKKENREDREDQKERSMFQALLRRTTAAAQLLPKPATGAAGRSGSEARNPAWIKIEQ